jgi:NAD-reducing hydrogenase large subunit
MSDVSVNSLETAPGDRESLRRVVIDPVSRVEGHGKVTLLIDDQDVVQEARLHIVEFRGFEVFIQGRPYWEVPVMVQRLCGICPVSHHLAAAKALDRVVGGYPVPLAAEKLRRLMHYGQILQSHALHFFHLSSPDLLFGFDSDVAQRNIVGVAAKYPDVARQGILLRQFGQEVIEATAGKRIHGTGAIPGGMNKALAPADRTALRAKADTMVEWSLAAVKLVAQLHESNPALYDGFGYFRSKIMSLVRADGAMDLYDGHLRFRDDKGQILVDGLEDQRYFDVIREEVKPWSYMKFPFMAEFGPEEGWYKVGPLARVQNCDFIPSPLAEEERQRFIAYGQGDMIHATLAYHWARMIEMLHAAEVIRDLLGDETLNDGPLVAQGTRTPGGVGIIEAPRGTLIHHYRVGEDDLVTMCNLIVSTTHNNQPMNRAVREVAQKYLSGQRLTEGLLNHIEVAIRAYDPCLSCATHALGQMPLILELATLSGEVIDRVVRD